MKHINAKFQKHINVTDFPVLHQPQELPQPTPAPSPAPPDSSVNRQRDVEMLNRMMRADSFYKALTNEQRLQLLEWIEKDQDIVTIWERLNAPPPDGFGVKVHMTSLRRFRTGLRAADRIARNQEMVDTVFEMESRADLTQFDRFQMAISHMLHEHAFDLARTYPGDETVTRLISGIQKLAAIDFQRQKLALERERLKTQFARYHRVDLNIVPPQTQPPAPHTSPITDARVTDHAHLAQDARSVEPLEHILPEHSG